ncbi:hypothetical protein NDU88_000218 [Pleurodeles waltl]|uniref:Secreted protein n=1 Tax=Pleurodeles waltl TaxID=8319 RepID=A0AAV7P4D3_PLEWA|nr:hypothetical protein NDU88_000218 [Pleurodeles waltl]
MLTAAAAPFTALAVVLQLGCYRQDCVLMAEVASDERLLQHRLRSAFLQLWQWFCSRAQLQEGLCAGGSSAFHSSGSGFAGQAQLQAGLRADGGSVSSVSGAPFTALTVVLWPGSVTGTTACSRRKQCQRSAFYSSDGGSVAGLSYRQDCVLTAEAASEERLIQL